MAIPSKSAIALVRLALASTAWGEVGPKTLLTSDVTFSSSILAIETAPKLQPARVKGTHGAGAFIPLAASMMGVVSVVVFRGSVQYVNEDEKLSKNLLPPGLK